MVITKFSLFASKKSTPVANNSYGHQYTSNALHDMKLLKKIMCLLLFPSPLLKAPRINKRAATPKPMEAMVVQQPKDIEHNYVPNYIK